MLKADVLRERKRLKAVRREKRKMKNHNYITKTLEKPSPIFEGMTHAIRDTIFKLINFNKERIISRSKSRKEKGGKSMGKRIIGRW